MLYIEGKYKILIGAVIALLVTYLGITAYWGMNKNTNVFLNDYSISSDGTVIDINIGTSGSVGYVSKISTKYTGTDFYITFYKCPGGINSQIGAKSDFTIKVPKKINRILFNRGGINNWEPVLVMDSGQGWTRPGTD